MLCSCNFLKICLIYDGDSKNKKIYCNNNYSESGKCKVVPTIKSLPNSKDLLANQYDEVEEIIKKDLEKAYYELKKELQDKAENFPLNSLEVVEVSHEMDEYIIQAMKELNSND
ncbi:aspartyl-phosphate phosphatase Spo0E family protein [Sporohalobacter salinus]|uniref:aspartyl-phosphate phosphatase Spo0E family protein n=1 Tax=Sporohalobacter salinus TaxID=1494606 RepID=UPI001960EA3C|nr:aspartyl-phosphate phosphatase Spo0E family protein [Sporohalobacter salinus]MBM7622829.1 uncharacterized membrane-anchored protein YjiN (DUF445 family) [Sporohalobacter salinus]